MIYYKTNENLIEKYQVSFDKPKIIELIDKIQENCSTYTHYSVKSAYGLGLSEYMLARLKNFTYKTVGSIEKGLYIDDVIHYEYDKPEFPKLADILRGFLRSDEKSVGEFKVYNPDNDKTIDNEINDLSKKLCDSKNTNIDEKKKIIERLDYLLKMKKEIKESRSINDYYKEACEIIKVELIDTLEFGNLITVENFFNTKLAVDHFVRTRSGAIEGK